MQMVKLFCMFSDCDGTQLWLNYETLIEVPPIKPYFRS